MAARRRSLESRVIASLLDRRCAVLALVLSLQLLLVASLGALLWASRVRNEIAGKATFVSEEQATSALGEKRSAALAARVRLPQRAQGLLRVGSRVKLSVSTGETGKMIASTGWLIHVEEGPPPVALIALEPPADGSREPLGRLLSSGEEAEVLLEVRSERLLSLLLRR